MLQLVVGVWLEVSVLAERGDSQLPQNQATLGAASSGSLTEILRYGCPRLGFAGNFPMCGLVWRARG